MDGVAVELILAVGAVVFLASFFLPAKWMRYAAAAVGGLLLVAGAVAGWAVQAG
ncbi:hypothetical protein BH23VER1_BH23VER1_04690 [soil metagenome]